MVLGDSHKHLFPFPETMKKENIWCRETYSPLISSCGDVIIGLLVLKIFNAGWGDYMSNLLVFVSTSLIDNGV